MTVNRQQSTVNDHQECLYTLDAHQRICNHLQPTQTQLSTAFWA
ncbi:hypothetical protein ACEYW6_34330 [Nostoc sp. UIC 10607]